MIRTETPEALAAFSLALLKSAGADAASAEAATAALMHA